MSNNNICFHYEKKAETVIVINSTNINKSNNPLSPHIIEHKKKTNINEVGYPELAFKQRLRCADF